MKPSEQQLQELASAAIEARKQAYAPYSKFAVGAALLTADGRQFVGVNVENSSFGLTICAERTAVFSAVTAGARDFVAIAIATAGGAGPCGACRQVLCEFSPNATVLLVDVDNADATRKLELSSLLPERFHLGEE